jgi:hypothetical protein
MILITTQAEFLELVEELRGMATAAERRSGNHQCNNRAAFATRQGNAIA